MMETDLDRIKFEKDNCDFMEELATYGLDPIKALIDAVVNYKINDELETCIELLHVLEDKIHAVDECYRRLLDEMILAE